MFFLFYLFFFSWEIHVRIFQKPSMHGSKVTIYIKKAWVTYGRTGERTNERTSPKQYAFPLIWSWDIISREVRCKPRWISFNHALGQSFCKYENTAKHIKHFLCLFLGSLGFNWLVFFCSSIPVVLFDSTGISKCFNTLFLSSPHLCFIIGFICDLLVSRNDWWMNWKTSTGIEQICFYHCRCWWRGLASHKASFSSPPPSPLAPPPPPTPPYPQ